MEIHARSHEMGKEGRIRIWTDEMQDYGQFSVVEHDNAQKFKKVCNGLSIPIVWHHCDGFECKCKRMGVGEKFE